MLLSVFFVLCWGGDESEAIKKAALGYLDGWFQSNPKIMDEAIHPNLVKYRVKKVNESEHEFLDVMTKPELVGICHVNQKWVEGKGHQAPEILFQNAEIAVVFAQSDGFYDLINLAKINGKWQIVQVLWNVGQGRTKASD